MRGILCQNLVLTPSTQKGIAVTRMFGRPITDLDELLEAVASYVARAG